MLDSLMADLHLWDLSGCFNDVQRREETDIPSPLVNDILLFANPRFEELEKASLGIRCCTMFEDSSETALMRLTRPVTGSLSATYVGICVGMRGIDCR